MEGIDASVTLPSIDANFTILQFGGGSPIVTELGQTVLPHM